jgi:hypothetical protein
VSFSGRNVCIPLQTGRKKDKQANEKILMGNNQITRKIKGLILLFTRAFVFNIVIKKGFGVNSPWVM